MPGRQVASPGTTRPAVSRFHRPKWYVLACNVVSAACGVAVLATANDRLVFVLLAAMLLGLTALSTITATLTSSHLAFQFAIRVAGVSLLGAFAVIGLVPVSQWLGQIIGPELIRSIPTPQHTPTLRP